MELGNTVEVRKIAAWNRIFNVSFKSIFGGLTSLGVLIGTANPWEAGKTLLSMFVASVSEENDKPEQRAYLLMYGALRQGMLQLVMDSVRILREHNKIGYEASAFQELADKLETLLGKEEISIDEDFFDKPEQHALFLLVKPKFHEWLLWQGLHRNIALQISKRLDFYYVRQIDALIAEKPDYFGSLKQKLERSEAQRRLWARHLYNQFIISQWKSGIFDESFGLDEIYVGLNGCYPIGEQSREMQKRLHKVVDAEQHIWEWLQTPKLSFQTMVLRGGPGSGKSSLMKKIAKRLAEEDERSFYLIPLQHFKFPQGVAAGIQNFIDNQIFLNGKENPCDVGHHGIHCKSVFVFDGLDELSRTGKSGEAIAKELVTGIKDFLSEYNAKGVDWDFRAIITGRDLVVQQSAELSHPQIGQVLELLPYKIVYQDHEWRTYEFEDPEKRLDKDLRQVWWRQYWQARGEKKTAIPEELKAQAYESLSCQPLLSYLLARAFSDGKLDAATRENINVVYERLIGDVKKREWGGKSGFEHAERVDEKKFMRLLEELAITAWQSGDVRATTVRAFDKRCEDPEVKRYLKEFASSTESNPTDLMVSFFTRRVGHNKDEEALIEFTHKSFGEYLVARRIAAIAKTVAEGFAKEAPRDREYAMKDWLYLTVPVEITEYIWDFLAREVALQYEHQTEAAGMIQKGLAELFSTLINDGFDLKFLEEKTNNDIIRASRNAESSLLLVISGFARVSELRTMIHWQSADQPLQVLSRLMLGNAGLVGLGLNRVVFPVRVDFWWIYLVNANLSGAYISKARLNGADLSGADFGGADLSGASLGGTRLYGACLYGTDLTDADLTGADLTSADLTGADLTGADLTGADLTGADLTGADLTGADLTGADLTGARFYPFFLEFGDKLMDGPKAYDYLVSQSALNVPKLKVVE